MEQPSMPDDAQSSPTVRALSEQDLGDAEAGVEWNITSSQVPSDDVSGHGRNTDDGDENGNNVIMITISREKSNESTTSGEEKEKDDEEESVNVMAVLLGKPYAAPIPIFTTFYIIDAIAIAIQATIFGLFALGYLNVVYEVPKLWLEAGGNESYPDDASTTGFGDGKPWWIGVGAATGLVLGIFKSYVFKFDTYTGFVEDLLELNANPSDIIKVAGCCLISLMGGACVGPESGLGAACGGMSVLWAKRMISFCIFLKRKKERKSNQNNDNSLASGVDCEQQQQQQQQQQSILNDEEEESQRRTKLLVLAGMVSAFSTILPSPASAILVCLELPGFERLTKVHGLHYARTLSLLTLAGTISYMVYTSIEGNTWLGSDESRGIVTFYQYEYFDIVLAVAYGAMGALLAVVYLIIGGIVQLTFTKLKNILDSKIGWNKRIVVVSMIGGTLFGILNYAFPLVVGDGSYQIGTVIRPSGRQIETSVLIVSAFMKILAYWISSESGFVGGIFFPLLIMSSLIGRVVVNETSAGWAITMACSLVALASAITPMPIAMLALATSTFNLNSQGAIPLLVCTTTANVFFAGLGVPQKILSLASAQKQQ